MKKNILTIALSIFLGSSVLNAQDNGKVAPCQTYNAMEQVFANDPSARIRYNEEQEKLRLATIAYEASLKNNKVGAAVQYTVPVVFHILHTYGPENISDANCIASLANINNDYGASSSDIGTIDPLFASRYVNTNVKFMLAHKDPLGNCTSGIVHHYNTSTLWNQASPNYAYSGTAAGQWNPTKYLNIYVVTSICPSSATCSTASGIIQGYTYKPGTLGTGSPADAFVVIYSEVNSSLTSSRTLSHEIGHWLNLSHTWGNTNNAGVTCGDDGVTDTPITKGFFSTCPSSSVGSGCTAGGENVENIMDYSSCPKMFTSGQSTVMITALSSAVSGRNNLWTAANIGSSGTDVNGTGVCSPIADFYTTYGITSNVYSVCAGGTLTFNDVSYNATVTTRSWAGSGGATVASPTAATTGITFPTAGIQTVTLTVGNASGSSSMTRTVNVIAGPANYPGTYQESFETAGLPANWSIINAGGTTWQQITTAAATGTNSYYMNNASNTAAAIDILETPSYDFASNPGATYTFKYAFALKNATWTPVFKVQASSNCGGSWSDIYVPSVTTLASGSGGTTTTPFFPTPAQFKLYTLTLHPAFNVFKSQPNVRIRFFFQENASAGAGNNFFLDDINFNGTLGVNELTKSIGFNVYPNPTSGSATVEFTLNDNSNVSYNVIDVIGRVVEQQKPVNLAPGHHAYTVNESQTLKSGIYFVSFELNGQKMSRKLIID